jgi:hypothetical protein
MANAVEVNILEDGPRNTIVRLAGQLDTSMEAYNVKLAPATYRTTYNLGPYGTPTTWRIDFIEFSISDGMSVNLWWDATTPVIIVPLAGRGNKHFKDFGGYSGYTAQAAAGWTGGLGLSTTFTSPPPTLTTGDPLIYMVMLNLVQQGPNLS